MYPFFQEIKKLPIVGRNRLRKHCCIQKCRRITHGMSFERRKREGGVDGQLGIFKETTIGSLHTVHPNQDELFFLRMLMVNMPGPTSFQKLRIVNGVTHITFRGARQALELLENDRHWDVCINDACNTSHPNQIRALFAIILTACSPSNKVDWEKYKLPMEIFSVEYARKIQI